MATSGGPGPQAIIAFDIGLDLSLLPAGSGIAERGLEYVVVCHRKEPHVVVDAALRDTAEDPEPVPVGIKQHLMGLQQIRPDQKGPAVRQLNVGNLQLGAFAAENCKILAPVKLERLARTKQQGDEGAAACRLLISLPIGPPVTCKSRNPSVGPVKAENHQIGMHLLQCPPLFARLPRLRLRLRLRFRLQPAGQLLGERIELALPLWRREQRLDHAEFKYFLMVLRDIPVRRAISRRGNFSRKAIRQMMFKSPMCIPPMSPVAHGAGGKGHMGQFSMEIRPLPGSLLGGNQQVTFLPRSCDASTGAIEVAFHQI